jgi:hypothetical protein
MSLASAPVRRHDAPPDLALDLVGNASAPARDEAGDVALALSL